LSKVPDDSARPPLEVLYLTKEQLKELDDWYVQVQKEHNGHPINASMAPTTGTDFVWFSYCITCKAVIGRALISDRLARDLMEARMKAG